MENPLTVSKQGISILPYPTLDYLTYRMEPNLTSQPCPAPYTHHNTTKLQFITMHHIFSIYNKPGRPGGKEGLYDGRSQIISNEMPMDEMPCFENRKYLANLTASRFHDGC